MDILKKLQNLGKQGPTNPSEDVSKTNREVYTVEKDEYTFIGGVLGEAEERIAPYEDEALNAVVGYIESRRVNLDELKIPENSKESVKTINDENKVYVGILEEIAKMESVRVEAESVENKHVEHTGGSEGQTLAFGRYLVTLKNNENIKRDEGIKKKEGVASNLEEFYKSLTVEEKIDLATRDIEESKGITTAIEQDVEIIKLNKEIPINSKIREIFSGKLMALEDQATRLRTYIPELKKTKELWASVEVHEDIIKAAGKSEMDSVINPIWIEGLEENLTTIEEDITEYKETADILEIRDDALKVIEGMLNKK